MEKNFNIRRNVLTPKGKINRRMFFIYALLFMFAMNFFYYIKEVFLWHCRDANWCLYLDENYNTLIVFFVIFLKIFPHTFVLLLSFVTINRAREVGINIWLSTIICLLFYLNIFVVIFLEDIFGRPLLFVNEVEFHKTGREVVQLLYPDEIGFLSNNIVNGFRSIAMLLSLLMVFFISILPKGFFKKSLC